GHFRLAYVHFLPGSPLVDDNPLSRPEAAPPVGFRAISHFEKVKAFVSPWGQVEAPHTARSSLTSGFPKASCPQLQPCPDWTGPGSPRVRALTRCHAAIGSPTWESPVVLVNVEPRWGPGPPER
ncbi:hypothetical protein H1C71_040957, partial [Ictidomys tridecemlineatus]